MIKDVEDKFVDFLSQKKLKYTSQRRTILSEAFRVRGHFTAEELLESAKKKDRSISKATIYRTLSLLKESRLLEEQDFGSGRKLYERLSGRPHHDHLICIRCNRILEFENEQIERLQSEEAASRGFTIVFHSHKLFGFCGRCGTGADAGAGAGTAGAAHGAREAA